MSKKKNGESGAQKLARLMEQAIKAGNPPPLPGLKIDKIKVGKTKTPPKNKKGRS